MENMRPNCARQYRRISGWLVARDSAVSGRIERDRRTGKSGEEGTMRQVIRAHRMLTVLAVGLLALAAPLVASANGGGPIGG